ncbi:unnamed protein product (macronuclear) [Paramecium tetraurelia]|uniref:Transmembrane protein n=1 Tax=Paramecium tetraurelia TaxID=5888 RepID=A0BMH7_PARTE|nr:uncharacterized protein GSPATT00030380001 [Paramecium tetraurelia]CAK59744.1 unnamed protein product [Paramecium tetraurelia]|eukprot:XP_001427142.1 hypothetical protein (macronuclear) [Paramecium tetraurelia strain d4-2]
MQNRESTEYQILKNQVPTNNQDQKVPYFQLLRFASKKDKLLMIIGGLIVFLNVAAFPSLFYHFRRYNRLIFRGRSKHLSYCQVFQVFLLQQQSLPLLFKLQRMQPKKSIRKHEHQLNKQINAIKTIIKMLDGEDFEIEKQQKKPSTSNCNNYYILIWCQYSLRFSMGIIHEGLLTLILPNQYLNKQ